MLAGSFPVLQRQIILVNYMYIHPQAYFFSRRKYQLVLRKFELFSAVGVARWQVAWSPQEKLFKIAMFGSFVKGKKYMWVHLIPWEGWKKLLRRYTWSSKFILQLTSWLIHQLRKHISSFIETCFHYSTQTNKKSEVEKKIFQHYLACLVRKMLQKIFALGHVLREQVHLLQLFVKFCDLNKAFVIFTCMCFYMWTKLCSPMWTGFSFQLGWCRARVWYWGRWLWWMGGRRCCRSIQYCKKGKNTWGGLCNRDCCSEGCRCPAVELAMMIREEGFNS